MEKIHYILAGLLITLILGYLYQINSLKEGQEGRRPMRSITPRDALRTDGRFADILPETLPFNRDYDSNNRQEARNARDAFYQQGEDWLQGLRGQYDDAVDKFYEPVFNEDRSAIQMRKRVDQNGEWENDLDELGGDPTGLRWEPQDMWRPATNEPFAPGEFTMPGGGLPTNITGSATQMRDLRWELDGTWPGSGTGSGWGGEESLVPIGSDYDDDGDLESLYPEGVTSGIRTYDMSDDESDSDDEGDLPTGQEVEWAERDGDDPGNVFGNDSGFDPEPEDPPPTYESMYGNESDDDDWGDEENNTIPKLQRQAVQTYPEEPLPTYGEVTGLPSYEEAQGL